MVASKKKINSSKLHIACFYLSYSGSESLINLQSRRIIKLEPVTRAFLKMSTRDVVLDMPSDAMAFSPFSAAATSSLSLISENSGEYLIFFLGGTSELDSESI